MSEENEGNSGKQVIARAAAVLRALENQTGGLSLAQIAKGADLPRTTVHRIVAALEAQQLVSSGAGGVKLGPAIARLAASAHTDVVAVLRPHAEALGRRTRETVDVCVYRGLHAVSVDQYCSDHELRVVSAVGTAYPIHCTAHGKALLAQMPDEALARLFGERLEARTGQSIAALARAGRVRHRRGPGHGHERALRAVAGRTGPAFPRPAGTAAVGAIAVQGGSRSRARYQAVKVWIGRLRARLQPVVCRAPGWPSACCTL